MQSLQDSAATTAAPPLARCAGGALRGTRADGVLRFLAVPYAAPPVGPNRFAPPQPVHAWDGVRDATSPGFVAPQLQASPEETAKMLPGLDLSPLIGESMRFGDDYLVSNIWTPSLDARAPVMVFIHGGAFTGGAGGAPVYDGTSFARRGVVCVTINYRLGVEGFLPIAGAPTNLGLRDQIAALKWVQENIAAFGGDAANVTVFGESAGAMSIGNLVVSPLAKGLFKRAIIQSGHGAMVRPISVAQRLTKRIAKILRVSPNVEGFRQASTEDCLKAMRKVSLPAAGIDLRDETGREPAFGLSRFLPVYGDDVLPEHPHKALASGAAADIDILIGTNRDEMNLYFVHAAKKLGKFLAKMMVKRVEPAGVDVLRAYGLDEKGRRTGEVFTEALTDLVFCLPARRFAQAHKGRTWFYEFKWKSGAYDGAMGACHAIELPFVFNTLSTVSGPQGLAGPNPPQAIADRMNALWCDFARSGELPWPQYEAATPIVCTPETGQFGPDRDMPADRFIPRI